MVLHVPITAPLGLILSFLFASTLAEPTASNTSLYQFNATMDRGSTAAPGSRLIPVTIDGSSTTAPGSRLIPVTIDSSSTTAPGSRLIPMPEPTVGYTEQANITANYSKLQGSYTTDDLFTIGYEYCCTTFEKKIQRIGNHQWCNWTAIDSFYSDLTACSENAMEHFGSYWPNEVGEKLLILMHMRYFQNCNVQEHQFLIDPPENTVLGLIMAPICIIPFMVALVVWCNKNSEANAKK
ncbi:receptor activity-modifying protein 2 [Heptranchias perlo]|uniref:receptor activity-modifying protein 2 n=1 Tax=Heptranchias perlo TaxID=212740 RepID=UPI00355969B6